MKTVNQKTEYNNSQPLRLTIGIVLLCMILSLNTAIAQSSRSKENQKTDPLTSINNDYVSVEKNSMDFCNANLSGYGKRVVVALNKTVITSNKGKTRLKRGEVAVFPAGKEFRIKEGDFFVMALKSDHPPVKKPEQWLEPVKNKVVYEDEEFRIFEERLSPGDTRELHSHSQRVVVRLNLVQLTDPRFTKKEGSTGGIQEPNTVKFAEPIVHVVKNLSKDTDLFNIVIELK